MMNEDVSCLFPAYLLGPKRYAGNKNETSVYRDTLNSRIYLVLILKKLMELNGKL